MIHTRCNMKPYPRLIVPSHCHALLLLEEVGSEAAKVVADSARAEAEAVGQKVCQLHAQES